MLNDIKPPPLDYGMPGPDPATPRAAAVKPVVRATVSDVRAVVSGDDVTPVYEVSPNPPGVQQPPAHRDVLEGHVEMPRHDPASARTPAVLDRLGEGALGNAAHQNPRVSAEVARGARRGDIPDGGTYEYPSRGSFDNLALSIVVVIGFVLLIGYVAFRLF